MVSAAFEWMKLSRDHTEETEKTLKDGQCAGKACSILNNPLIICLINLISLVNYLTVTWQDDKARVRTVPLENLENTVRGAAGRFFSTTSPRAAMQPMQPMQPCFALINQTAPRRGLFGRVSSGVKGGPTRDMKSTIM